MKAIVYIFFFFVMFPYIDFLDMGIDTQPNALLLACLLAFGLKNKRINLPIILLGILFLLALAMAVDSELVPFVTFKNVVNYLSPGLLCFIAYNIFSRTKIKIPFSYFMGCIMFYFFVAYMQMFVIHDFMSSIIGTRGIMFLGRGVVSLTPEPAFYGTNMLYYSMFSILYYNKKQNFIAVPIMLFQLLFLAQTATAIGMCGVAAGIFGLIQVLKLNVKAVSGLAIGLIFLLIFQGKIRQKIEETRVGIIVEQVIKDPLMLALVDESVSVRLASTYSPVMNMRHNYFMPQGFGRFQSFITRLYHEGHYKKILTLRTVLEKDKLGGGINMVMFHLGFLGLIFPLAIYLCFRKLIHRPIILYCFILYSLLLCTQMQLLNPIVGVILGTALYKSNEVRKKQNGEMQLT